MKSDLSGESSSDSPQSATEGTLKPLSGNRWRIHDVLHQVCGYVLLTVPWAASLGI